MIHLNHAPHDAFPSFFAAPFPAAAAAGNGGCSSSDVSLLPPRFRSESAAGVLQTLMLLGAGGGYSGPESIVRGSPDSSNPSWTQQGTSPEATADSHQQQQQQQGAAAYGSPTTPATVRNGLRGREAKGGMGGGVETPGNSTGLWCNGSSGEDAHQQHQELLTHSSRRRRNRAGIISPRQGWAMATPALRVPLPKVRSL